MRGGGGRFGMGSVRMRTRTFPGGTVERGEDRGEELPVKGVGECDSCGGLKYIAGRDSFVRSGWVMGFPTSCCWPGVLRVDSVLDEGAADGAAGDSRNDGAGMNVTSLAALVLWGGEVAMKDPFFLRDGLAKLAVLAFNVSTRTLILPDSNT